MCTDILQIKHFALSVLNVIYHLVLQIITLKLRCSISKSFKNEIFYHLNQNRKLSYIDYLNIDSNITKKGFHGHYALYLPIKIMTIEILKAIFLTS